jgi:hypothetical protein
LEYFTEGSLLSLTQIPGQNQYGRSIRGYGLEVGKTEDNMTEHSRCKGISVILKKSAFLACKIMIIDAVGVAIASISLSQNFSRYYTLLTLVQAASLFLVGGAKDLSGSLAFTRAANYIGHTKKQWTFEKHRDAQEKAALYVASGIVLLVFSFILAYPLNWN